MHITIRVLVLAALLVHLGILAAPLSTEFSYQGSLVSKGSPVTGDFDFKFSLFNVEINGQPVGAEFIADDVPVVAGIFDVALDFGSSPFQTQEQLWIEIQVREGASAGLYTTLEPRQKVLAPPYVSTVNPVDTSHTFATNNTAVGSGAMQLAGNVSDNVAVGVRALTNTNGAGNTAIGYESLLSNDDGINNVSVGRQALAANVSGNGNIAIGVSAGADAETGNANIYIGAAQRGVANEFGVTRVGTLPSTTKAFLYGIYPATSEDTRLRAVYVDSDGQVVTAAEGEFSYSISALTLNHPNLVRHVGFGEAYMAAGTSVLWATAPVHLPQAAVVKALACTFKDADSAGLLDINLSRHNGTAESKMVSVATTNEFSTDLTWGAINGNVSFDRIDNDTYAYYLVVKIAGEETGSKLSINQCKVIWSPGH